MRIFSLRLILCLTPFTSTYGMEGVKRARVEEESKSNPSSNSNSPTKSTQTLLKYWNPRLAITPDECETIDLSTALCLLKSGKKIRATELKDINLSSSSLTRLPAGFSQLTALQKLSLEYNAFTRIPPEVCCHSSLTELDISRNPLEEFPTLTLPVLRVLTARGIAAPHVGRMLLSGAPNLVRLVLIENNITELPPCICQLTALELLDIASNKLTRLPDEIDQLTSLQELILDGNQLQTLPGSIGALTNLRSLSINGNALTVFPQNLTRLESLNNLSAKDNQLTEIPEGFGHLNGLQVVHLDGNTEIKSLPASVTTMNLLEVISIKGTKLAEMIRIWKRLEKRDVKVFIE